MLEPCFPEPLIADEREGQRGETLGAFLARSTWQRAVETRAFYNESLAALPDACGRQLCDRLRQDRTQATLFELVVGRFLQLLGATGLECEPGRHRRVDWRAEFADGTLHVEAMVPVYNASAGLAARRHSRLLDVVERWSPDGWWVLPLGLPALSESAPLGPFTKVVKELLGQLPDAGALSGTERIELVGAIPEGRIRITATPATAGGGLGSGAAVSYADDSEVRVAAAWQDRRKRQQGRSVPPPALLALMGGFTGADLEDFQNALFGRDLRVGSEPTGVMATDRDPPWAGVVAFPKVSPAGVDDPVLFVAPHYGGVFPEAISRLEARRLVEGRVSVAEAGAAGVMDEMRWARP